MNSFKVQEVPMLETVFYFCYLLLCLIIEYFALTYYKSLKDEIEIFSDTKLSKLLNLIKHKYGYYYLANSELFDPEDLDEKESRYSQCLEMYYNEFCKAVSEPNSSSEGHTDSDEGDYSHSQNADDTDSDNSDDLVNYDIQRQIEIKYNSKDCKFNKRTAFIEKQLEKNERLAKEGMANEEPQVVYLNQLTSKLYKLTF